MKKTVLHIISILASAVFLISAGGISFYMHTCDIHNESYITFFEHNHDNINNTHDTNSDYTHNTKKCCKSDTEYTIEKYCCSSHSETKISENSKEHNCCSDIKISVKIEEIFISEYFHIEFIPHITELQGQQHIADSNYFSDFNIYSEIYIPPESTFLRNCNFRL